MRDFALQDHGSLMLLVPLTMPAQEWVDENIPADAMHWGAAIVVEPRYIGPIIEGATGDGLIVELEGSLLRPIRLGGPQQ
jgi:hypothetical protein